MQRDATGLPLRIGGMPTLCWRAIPTTRTACASPSQVRYMNGSSTTQKNMVGTGMTYQDTLSYIEFNPGVKNPGVAMAEKPKNFSVGTVKMEDYLQWLRKNGYDLGDLTVQ